MEDWFGNLNQLTNLVSTSPENTRVLGTYGFIKSLADAPDSIWCIIFCFSSNNYMYPYQICAFLLKTMLLFVYHAYFSYSVITKYISLTVITTHLQAFQYSLRVCVIQKSPELLDVIWYCTFLDSKQRSSWHSAFCSTLT